MIETQTLRIFAGGILALFAGGIGCAITGRRAGSSRLGVLSAVIGCLLSGGAALSALLSNRSVEAALDWTGIPFCTVRLGIDPLSAFFACAISAIGLLGAVYAMGYWAAREGRRSLGWGWAEYLFLLGAMLLVVVARDAIVFLVAWETMSVVSFLLVMFDGTRRETLEAGWVYLTAGHLGVACLLVMFLVMGRGLASLDFAVLGGDLGAGARTAVFVLALVGFGSKAGFVPMHVWLPEAHPAAPSHVSALMSGVMIKMGIYGILRVLILLGTPSAWWGWALLVIGAVSGVLGVVFALAQHDLKRLLAYHSVENIGIIALGLGLGVLGWSEGCVSLAALGFAGALLHVLNHAVFKGLLFLAAGSVLHATHTGNMDRLGGLMRRMPATGTLFVLGAAAISGLPPLNGFVSEFLIYLGALRGISGEAGSVACRLAGILVLGSLSLIGGLACACFVKAAGTVFLGEPRGAQAAEARESGFSMLWPMGVLGVLCIGIGLGGPVVLKLARAALSVVPFAGMAEEASFSEAGRILGRVSAGGGALLLACLALLAVRRALLKGKSRAKTVTWDCGYGAPSSRMQYTSSSFASPLVGLFRPFLRTQTRLRAPDGLFPSRATLHTHTGDVFRSGLFKPMFRLFEMLALSVRPLQHGRIQVYVVYLALTLLVLLVWKLR